MKTDQVVRKCFDPEDLSSQSRCQLGKHGRGPQELTTNPIQWVQRQAIQVPRGAAEHRSRGEILPQTCLLEFRPVAAQTTSVTGTESGPQSRQSQSRPKVLLDDARPA